MVKDPAIVKSVLEDQIIEAFNMEGAIVFKTLHSREYQGHKKKVQHFQTLALRISFFPISRTWYSSILCLCHKQKVHSVAWNCTGTKLASGSVDQTARIWQIEPHGHVRFTVTSFFCFSSIPISDYLRVYLSFCLRWISALEIVYLRNRAEFLLCSIN